MANVIINDTHLNNIADAIRNKNGTSTKYKPSEMADAISNIETGGGITPTGTIDITENGTYDVTEYASANVNVEGSGGISVDDVAQKTISGDIVLTVETMAQRGLEGYPISSVDAQNLVSIPNYAFSSSELVTANFPKATTLGTYAFQYCYSLQRIKLPVCTSIGRNAFQQNTVLNMVDLPCITSIALYAFYWCRQLDTIILRSPSVVTLGNSNAFQNAGANVETLYFYVPSDLVEAYKSATNWSTYADQFRAIEDYPEICGEG